MEWATGPSKTESASKAEQIWSYQLIIRCTISEYFVHRVSTYMVCMYGMVCMVTVVAVVGYVGISSSRYVCMVTVVLLLHTLGKK